MSRKQSRASLLSLRDIIGTERLNGLGFLTFPMALGYRWMNCWMVKSSFFCWHLNSCDVILLHWVLQDNLVEPYKYWRKLVFQTVVTSLEFLEPPLTLSYVYCTLSICCINIPFTYQHGVTYNEITKQNMPNIFFCHLCYSFETNSSRTTFFKISSKI